jgi:hypothetical protein
MTEDSIREAERILRVDQDGTYRLCQLCRIHGPASQFHHRDNCEVVSVAAEIDRLKAELAEACELLKSKAAVFRHYEELHMSKLTDEGNRKAAENRNHAVDMEAFLQKVRPQ